jgi:ABC-type phosphate transport system permease subunit
MHLLFTTIGLVLVLLGIIFYFLAQRNRNPGFPRFSFTPIWKMKDRYNRAGYRYLWAGTLLIAISGVIGLLLGLSWVS